MANKSKGFVVFAQRRASGTPYWLVRGSVDGRQVRKEFADRSGALAYAEQQNSALNGAAPEQSQVLTHLSSDVVRNAETAARQLDRDFPGTGLLDLLDHYRASAHLLPPGTADKVGARLHQIRQKYPDADLPFIVSWFATNFRPPKSSLVLRIALEHYLADADRRRQTGSLSEPQFRGIGKEMTRLENFFSPEEPIANLTSVRLQEYLRESMRKPGDSGFANKTWSNRRGYLTTFFGFCVTEGWVEQNAATGIRNYRRRELAKPTPVVLTVSAARELMEFVETFHGGRLVPFYALCLFAGIRPDWQDGEISKIEERLFDLPRRRLSLPPEKTKTRRKRDVVLQPNLVAWLTKYPLSNYPIICTNFKKLRIKVQRRFRPGHDVLRHSYCSYLVGKFRSVGDTALQAGNSERVIWSNYLDLVSPEDADAFWKIGPVATANVTTTSDKPSLAATPVSE